MCSSRTATEFSPSNIEILKPQTRKLVFNSFILSNFNYCPLVWLTCNVTNTRKMEKIQERGLRIIYNDYVSSYKELLLSSGEYLLYVSRLKRLAVFVFKSINNLGPGIVNDMLIKKNIPYNLCDNSRAQLPKPSRSKNDINSISYKGSSL